MHKERLARILCFVPVAVLVIFRIGLDFNGLYGQDAHEYQRYALAISQFILGGDFPGRFFWPVNYPALGGMATIFTRDVNVALHIISTGCIVGFLYLIYRMYCSEETMVHLGLIILAFASIPTVLRSGLVIMSEAMTLAMLMGAILLFRRGTSSSFKLRDVALFVFISCLAIGTRYAVAAAIVPLVSFYMWIHRKKIQLEHIVVLLAVAILAAIPNLLLKVDFSWGLANHDLLERWSAAHFFSHQFNTANGMVSHSYPNLVFYGLGVFHWKYIYWSLPLLLLKKTWSEADRALGIVGIVYIIFISGVPEQNSRYIMPLVPVVASLLKNSFHHNANWERYGLLVPTLFVGVLLSQIFFSAMEMKPLVDQQRLEREITKNVCGRQTNILYTFAIDQALQSYGCKHHITNLWHQPLDDFKHGSLVLFNVDKFGAQWRGENPMINWRALNERYKVDLVETFSEGWKLYKVGEKK